MKNEKTSMDVTVENEKLSLKEKIGYGMGAMTENNMQNSVPAMTMPIMNITMGLDPIGLGYVAAAGRVFDALTDPLMGYLSDNTRSRWGRRKPYILMGAIFSALAFVMIWMFPVSGMTNLWYLGYFFITTIFYFAFTTMYCVPYISYGYELSKDYHERTTLMAFRMFFVSIGNIIVPWMFWFTQRKMFPNAMIGMRWAAVLMGIIFIVFALGPLLLTKKHSKEEFDKNNFKKVKAKDVFSVLRVKPFLCIIAALGLGVTGLVSVGSLAIYVIIYYVCKGDIAFGAEIQGLAATVSGILGVALLPVITYISKIMGKRNALIFLLLFSAAGAAASWFLYTPQYPYLGIAVAVFMIPGMTALWMLLFSMMADVCEYDDYFNNLRREGVFAAVMSWTGKVGVTLSLVLAGYILVWSGFVKELGVNQLPEALLKMRVLFASISAAGLTLAALAVYFFPLTEKKVYEIKQLLKERNK